MARFLCGGGMSLFVVREVGALPDGFRFCGHRLRKMVVVFGVIFPDPDGLSEGYHLVPAEYLVDPPLSGLPVGSTLVQARRSFLPLPRYSVGEPVSGMSGLHHSLVVCAVRP